MVYCRRQENRTNLAGLFGFTYTLFLHGSGDEADKSQLMAIKMLCSPRFRSLEDIFCEVSLSSAFTYSLYTGKHPLCKWIMVCRNWFRNDAADELVQRHVA